MGIYDRDYYQEDLRPMRPWDKRSMVTLLIIINAGVFLANMVLTNRSGALLRSLALQPQDLYAPLQWFRMATYAFTHNPQDITHILFNMVSLYFLGQGVEGKYGKWEFFRIYMVSAVVCGIVFCFVHQATPQLTLMGASGAVTTIAILFVLSFPQATLMLYGIIPVKAWVLGVIIVVGNILGNRGAIAESGGAQVAYDVHLVGAAFGAAYFFGNLNFGFVERLMSDTGRKVKQKQRGMKVHRPREEPDTSADEAEADRILDKISREGQDSLTRKERAFMEQYSKRIRQQRGGR